MVNPTGKLKLEGWKKRWVDTTEIELWEVAYMDVNHMKWYVQPCCTFRINYKILTSHNYCSNFRNKLLLLLADSLFLHDGAETDADADDDIYVYHSDVIICTSTLSGNIFIYCHYSMATTLQSISVKTFSFKDKCTILISYFQAQNILNYRYISFGWSSTVSHLY